MEKESIEEKLECAEGQPEEKDQPDVDMEKEEVAKPETESAEEQSESQEATAEGVNEIKEKTQDKTENIEERTESTEETSATVEGSEESVQKTAEIVPTAAGKTDDKNGVDKSSVNRKKVVGFVELAAAAILMILSFWLFLNTRGTRLLHVSVMTGRVSRYFWMFALAAAALGVTGLITLKKRDQ